MHKNRRFHIPRLTKVSAAIIGLAGVAVAGLSVGGYALASNSVYTGKVVLCWRPTSNHMPTAWIYPYTCPAGDKDVLINNSPGGTGPEGPQGPQGQQGAPGPSGVTAVKTVNLLSSPAPANSGGSFYAGGSATAGATQVGAGTSVPAGTYQVCMNAKATPEAAAKAPGTDVGISAQFFLYDQAKNSAFTGDLLNISTPLQPDGTGHDTYANGCTLATVPAGGQTWHVYAFGYDSDQGSGNYVVDFVTLTLVAITPAS